MSPSLLRSLWALYRKDLAVWWGNRATIGASILPVVGFLVIQSIGVAAVGRNPVALVTLDTGPAGQQMRQILYGADVFRLTDATPDQAQALLHNLQVAAVITIPADFTQRVQAHDPAPVSVVINNLNLDFTNDIRRAVPDAITQYYAAQGAASPIKVTLQETDLRARDVQFFEFSVLPMLVLLVMLNGLVTSAMATAREWESRTIKEVLLAPLPHELIIVGKVLACFTVTFALGLLVLGLGAALDWTRPAANEWLPTVLIIGLVSLLGTGLGVAVGAALQRIQAAIPIGLMLAIYLFFLAGGIGVLAFEPAWLQAIAVYDPLSYGVHGLQMAVFYASNDQFGLDVLVLSLTSLAALALGGLAVRRQIAN